LDKREKEISQGHEAERILRSPIYQEAFEMYRQSLLTAWASSGVKDGENRERLWLAYQIAGKVQQHIERVMTTGKMAQKQVEDMYGSA